VLYNRVVPAARPKPRSTALLWLVTLALTLLLAGLLGEGFARLAKVPAFSVKAADYIGWAKPDPVLGWRNNPGIHLADEGSHNPMTILPDGARDTGPEGNGPTVLIVGCSFAEGYGVRDNENFAWKLQERFPQLRIRDYGVPGYGTYQSLMLLSELMKGQGIHPALVIYGFLPFHADRNVLTYSMLEAFRSFGGQRFSPPHVEVKNGALEEFPPFAVPAWPLEQRSALVSLLHRAELRVRLADRPAQRAGVTTLLLDRMQTLVEGAGSKLLVATLWDGGDDPQTYKAVTANMTKAGIAQIDVTYAGSETRPERLHAGGTGSHPGPAVHDWWADKLAAWIEACGIAK